MRVFVTGASGFVGSAIVQELLKAGHQVTGLARSDSSAAALIDAGAAVHRGSLEDKSSLKEGAALADAVVHTAFNHDFSKYASSCEDDRRVILAMGEAMAGSGKPLLITSGIGLLKYNRVVTENDLPSGSDLVPRAASEEAANTVAAMGVNSYIVRLPHTVHGKGDHGFIPMAISMAKEKKVSAFIGDGNNRWPAVHRLDAAVIYRLILEQQPDQKNFHAVAEEGVPFREIAREIGKGLELPVQSKDGAEAEAHFGFLTHFAKMDCPASSEISKSVLGWKPAQIELIGDLKSGVYFE
ncbi:MAG: SDR family oxidoreductase [Pseudobacter sp.]|uniref:SDR family oxidoreductase n=1 Tax=Pseudobacter sp. TaxID=2045420 RepID=UPI003F801010